MGELTCALWKVVCLWLPIAGLFAVESCCSPRHVWCCGVGPRDRLRPAVAQRAVPPASLMGLGITQNAAVRGFVPDLLAGLDPIKDNNEFKSYPERTDLVYALHREKVLARPSAAQQAAALQTRRERQAACRARKRARFIECEDEQSSTRSGSRRQRFQIDAD
eukprot:gene41990-42185_t